MSKKFDPKHPWANCPKRFCPYPYIFDKYSHLFTSAHKRVWRALYSFQNPKNKTCYPPPEEAALRARVDYNRFCVFVNDLIRCHIISRNTASKHFKYPNYKFLTENCSKAHIERLEGFLGQLNNLPNRLVKYHPKKKHKKLTKSVSNNLPNRLVTTNQIGKLPESSKVTVEQEQQEKKAGPNRRSKLLTEEISNNKASSNPAVNFLISLVQNQNLSEKRRALLSEKISKLFELWRSWGLNPEKLKDFPSWEVIVRTEVAKLKSQDNPAGYLLKSLEDHYKIKNKSLEKALKDEWFPVPVLQGFEFDHLEKEVEKLENHTGLFIDKFMSKAIPEMEKNHKINQARLEKKESENTGSIEPAYLNDDEEIVGPYEKILRRYISNLTSSQDKTKFLAGSFSEWRKQKQAILKIRKSLHIS